MFAHRPAGGREGFAHRPTGGREGQRSELRHGAPREDLGREAASADRDRTATDADTDLRHPPVLDAEIEPHEVTAEGIVGARRQGGEGQPLAVARLTGVVQQHLRVERFGAGGRLS